MTRRAITSDGLDRDDVDGERRGDVHGDAGDLVPTPIVTGVWAVNVMVTGTPGVATCGDAARSQLRAARTTAGEMMKAAAIRMTTGSRLVAGTVMRLAVAVAKR